MKKLKSIGTQNKGCLNCGPLEELAPMRMRLYNEFGGHRVTKDGEDFYVPEQSTVGNEIPWEKRKTLQWVENRARKFPNSDFRLIAFMPLYEAEWQRQGRQRWVLVKKGMGFA